MIQLYNAKVLTPEGWVSEGAIIIEGTKIKAIEKDSLRIKDAQQIDMQGAYLLPGGIDLHIHGGGARDFMQCNAEAFDTVVRTHMNHGTTGILATLASSTVEMIERAAAVALEQMYVPQSPILGLHIEGRYLNPNKAGSQMPGYITLPDPTEYIPLLKKCPAIKRWSVSPELPGIGEFARTCEQYGIFNSIAHTTADYPIVKRAYAQGFRHATHFYNAMTTIHQEGEYKKAGTVEAIYAFPDINIEIIADGVHVPPLLIQLAHKVKGTEHLHFITDALACTAAENAEAYDPRVIVEDGVAKLSDRSALAGSVATMDRLIRVAHKDAEIPLREVSRMVSETPAKLLNVYNKKGSLEKGKDADIIAFDRSLNLQYVMSMGREIRNTFTRK